MNPNLKPGALAKPLKGDYRLEQRKAQRQRKATEADIMAEAKKRDHGKCRFPRCTFTDLRVESAHLVHRGMGGNPALDRTERRKLIALCLRHHQMLDRLRWIRIEPVDADLGTDGCCAFYEINPTNGVLEHIATEKLIGVSEPRRS